MERRDPATALPELLSVHGPSPSLILCHTDTEGPAAGALLVIGFDLVAFLARHAPAGADAHCGGGHARASGGAQRLEDWPAFLDRIGIGAEAA
jgi:hypothetical protein